MTGLITRLRDRSRDGAGLNGNGVSHVRLVPRTTRHKIRSRYVVTSAESAPCTCPDFCERDHDNE
jgi:hypothetical protein